MTITVRQLREALLGLPDDMPVLIAYEGITPPAVSVTVEDNPNARGSRAVVIDEEAPGRERFPG